MGNQKKVYLGIKALKSSPWYIHQTQLSQLLKLDGNLEKRNDNIRNITELLNFIKRGYIVENEVIFNAVGDIKSFNSPNQLNLWMVSHGRKDNLTWDTSGVAFPKWFLKRGENNDGGLTPFHDIKDQVRLIKFATSEDWKESFIGWCQNDRKLRLQYRSE